MDMRHYSSFLLRCWELDSEGERVEIEHIQSKDSTMVHSIAEAVAWIRAAHQDEPADHDTTDPPTD